jgi:hypothetical protein
MKANHAYRKTLFFLCSLLLLSSIHGGASQKTDLLLEYPEFEGDFYAEGILSFPPRAVPSDANLAVCSAEGVETESKVAVLKSWADGSLQKVQVVFPANAARRQKYQLVFGVEVSRSKKLAQTAVLPAVSFYAAGAPRAVENIDLNIGTLNVRVDRSPGISYYWHILPITFLGWLTWYRSRRLRDKG